MEAAIVLFFQIGGGPSPIMSLLPIGIIIFVFYFMVVRPQKAQQQEQQRAREDMLTNLKVGDKVVTTGGIYGSITELNDKEPVVQIRIADAVKINVARSAITGLQEPKNSLPESKKEISKESEKK